MVLATQTSVSSTTGKKTKLGSGYGKPTGWDEITRFLVNKLAPVFGAGVNVIRGTDAVGNPVTPQSMAENYLTPLLFQDAKDLYNERHGGMNGIGWALGGYGLGAFGVGLQTYKAKSQTGPSIPIPTGGAAGEPGGGGFSGGGGFTGDTGGLSGSGGFVEHPGG